MVLSCIRKSFCTSSLRPQGAGTQKGAAVARFMLSNRVQMTPFVLEALHTLWRCAWGGGRHGLAAKDSNQRRSQSSPPLGESRSANGSAARETYATY